MPRFRRVWAANGWMSRAKTGTIGAWALVGLPAGRGPAAASRSCWSIAALVVGRWDVLRNYWERLTRRSTVESIAQHAISSDTEYFCPMDPGIVSDWPGRCGVCNMALVRRKRGEAVMLPDGVVARMQLSPYRVQLAGIQTSPVGYRPLEREWRTTGLIVRDGEAATVVVELPSRQAPWVERGAVGGGRECGPPRPGTARRTGSLAGPGRGRRPGIRPRDDRDRQAAARAPRRAGRRRPVSDRRGRDRSVPRHAEEPARSPARRAAARVPLSRPSRDDRPRAGPLPDRPEGTRAPGAGRAGAAAMVVPDASGCHGRSGGRVVPRVRRDGARSRA